MSKYLLFFGLLFLSAGVAFGQGKLKRKYHGIYNGKINAYKLETNGELLDVAAVPIQVEIGNGTLKVHIGKTTSTGNFTILFEADDYLVLVAVMDNNSIGERIVVYKRGDKILRDGLYPQPGAVLFKID